MQYDSKMSGTKIANARSGSEVRVRDEGKGNETKRFLRALGVEGAAKTEVETARRVKNRSVRRLWMRETMRLCWSERTKIRVVKY